MASIELRVDIGGVDGIPHTFIIVTGSDNVERGYGFAPAVSGQLTGAGKIYDDTQHEYSSTTGKILIDEAGYQNLMAYINRSTENPPDYYLSFGSQCANWAFLALVEAGIDAVATPNMIPDSFLRDVFETIVWNPYTQWLSIELNTAFYNGTRSRPVPRDPLAIDLDGDSIETLGIVQGGNPVLFDHDADGTRTGTGWLQGDDAWLVLDRNGNGQIDSGRELFGVDTLISGTPGVDAVYARNGFEALSTLDANGDRVFNAADAAFTQVRLWRDLNQDGVSQANELSTLGSQNITGIGLTPSTTVTNLANGNTIISARGVV